MLVYVRRLAAQLGINKTLHRFFQDTLLIVSTGFGHQTLSKAPVNAVMARRYGLDRSNLVGRNCSIICGDDDNCESCPIKMVRECGIAHDLYQPGDKSWQARFPYLDFPDSHYVLHEPAPAQRA